MKKIMIATATLSTLLLAACGGGGGGFGGTGGERDANWEDRVDTMTQDDADRRRESLTGM